MDPSQYILFLFLFVLSGFFSGSELALMSLPSHKIDALVKQKKYGSKSLYHIKQQGDRLLIIILVGNNLVNVYTAALATQIALGIAIASGVEQSLAIAGATGIITFLILVFGEIIPKSFAVKQAEPISLLVAPVYRFLMTLFFPLIYMLEKLITLFTGKTSVRSISEEEIESFIDMGKDLGTLEDGEHERLRNALQFGEKLVEEIMVPRVRLDVISDEKTIDNAMQYYLEHTHSRIPVYHDTVDKIIGILTIRELARELHHKNNNKILRNIHFKPIIKVPLNQPIDILLETFRQKRQHIAIVMDEYGGVAGIITLEDIVEQLLGDLHDESDKEIPDFIHEADGSITIDASITIDELLDEFSYDLEDIGLDTGEFSGEAVSYIITHRLERFAEIGENIEFPIVSEEKSEIQQILVLQVHSLRDGAIEQVKVFQREESLRESV